jgi:hypothetical protein
MEYIENLDNKISKVSNNTEALKLIYHVRSRGNFYCTKPHCDYRECKLHLLDNRKAYICPICLTHYYPMSGTIMDHSHFAPRHWINLIRSFVRAPIAASVVAYEYECSYNTAYRVLDLIRFQMGEVMKTQKFSGKPVEIDEAGVLTGTKGLGRHYRFKKGRGNERYSSVLAIVERGSELGKMFKIESQSAEGIIPIILENVPKVTISSGVYNKKGPSGYKMFLEEFVDGNTEDTKFSTIATTIHGFRNVLAHQWLGATGHEIGFDYAMPEGWKIKDNITFINPRIYLEHYLKAFSTRGKIWGIRNFALEKRQEIKERLIQKFQEG